MFTYDDPTATVDGEFTDGDPLAVPAVPRTVLRDIWPNMIQRELINLVEGAGLTLDDADFTQVLQAVLALNTVSTPVGSVQHYAGQTAPTGWLVRNGDTIGSAASGADNADAQYEALYTLLWDNFDDADCPVTGGRGASAAADWAADKPMGMMDDRGLVDRAFDGTGSVDPDRAVGDFGSLQDDQIKAHSHDFEYTLISDDNGSDDGPSVGGDGRAVPGTLDFGGSETRMKNRAYLPIIKY